MQLGSHEDTNAFNSKESISVSSIADTVNVIVVVLVVAVVVVVVVVVVFEFCCCSFIMKPTSFYLEYIKNLGCLYI